MYCTHCGQYLNPENRFCTTCGQPVASPESAGITAGQSIPPDNTVNIPSGPCTPSASPTGVASGAPGLSGGAVNGPASPAAAPVIGSGSRRPARARQRLLARLQPRQRLVVRLVALLLVLAVLGVAVWQIGGLFGLWRQAELKQAAAGWQQQKDFKPVRNDVQAALDELADALEAGDVDTALAMVHPNRQEQYREYFTGNPDRLAEYCAALRAADLVYLSTDTGNYEAARMAIVELKQKSAASGADGLSPAFRLILTQNRDDGRWVIDS